MPQRYHGFKRIGLIKFKKPRLSSKPRPRPGARKKI